MEIIGVRFWILLAVLLPACWSERLYGSDSDIYSDVVHSIRLWKASQLAERLGTKNASAAEDSSRVCYGDLGCFERNGTFKHLKQLPEDPKIVGTEFLLYTKRNVNEPQVIEYKNITNVTNSNLDRNLPVILMTHGFGGRKNLTWLISMKNAVLSKENVNIIVVDWSYGARTPNYITAAVNCELVGSQIAAFLLFLKDYLGIQEENMHMIGFSLGAQVAGFVGKRMKLIGGTRPGRITGLDPASPLFEDYGGEVHLYKDDADFVDVVHTNADLLIYGGVGMGMSIGHVDYYPNGGKRQPGCDSTIKGAFIDIFNGNRERACNHERAVYFFIDSILQPTDCRFVSYPCDNYTEFEGGRCINCTNRTCGQMGYYGSGTGKNYLITLDKQPFCVENIAIQVHFHKQQKKSFGQIFVALANEDTEIVNVTLTKKDEKLNPGEEVAIATTIHSVFHSITEIRVKYVVYNGWILKGTPSFMIDAITVHDKFGKSRFNICSKGEIVLEDNIVVSFPAKTGTCP